MQLHQQSLRMTRAVLVLLVIWEARSSSRPWTRQDLIDSRLRRAQHHDRYSHGGSLRAPLESRRGVVDDATGWQPVTEVGFDHDSVAVYMWR
jgi:hypothetical protein